MSGQRVEVFVFGGPDFFSPLDAACVPTTDETESASGFRIRRMFSSELSESAQLGCEVYIYHFIRADMYGPRDLRERISPGHLRNRVMLFLLLFIL